MLFDFTVASNESARWHAALYAEMEHQRHRLQQIQRQLDGLLVLARRAGTPLVYDTNSLMHYEPPATILWDEIVEGPVRLVVPLVVIDELAGVSWLSGRVGVLSQVSAGAGCST